MGIGRTARATWMLAPPAELTEFSNDLNAPSSTLVSFAQGQVFERSLAKFNMTYRRAGFDHAELYDLSRLRSDPLFSQHAKTLDVADRISMATKQYHPSNRPYCGAFKAVAMWRALLNAKQGGYVMWADASRWADTMLPRDIFSNALATMQRRTARGCGNEANPVGDWPSQRWRQSPWSNGSSCTSSTQSGPPAHSVYGLVHCSVADCNDELFASNRAFHLLDEVTLDAFSELIPNREWLLNAPALLNTHILIKNTVANRLLIWDLLAMALAKPRGFCASHPQVGIRLSSSFVHVPLIR